MTTKPAAEQPDQSSRWTDLGRIVVAIDGSPSSSDAIELAVQMAIRHHSVVWFLHVAPLIDVEPSINVDAPAVALPHQSSRHERAILDDAAAIATSHGVVAQTALAAGNAAAEIVTFAAANDADVIMIGSHGHGLAASALLGSVSRRVLQTADRPVLIVRGAERT